MYKIVFSFVVTVFLTLALTGTGCAQFSFKSIQGTVQNAVNTVKGGGSTPTVDLGTQQDDLVNGYVAANKDVLNANAKMAEALGLKVEAATAKATAEALTEGATKDSLETSNKMVSASTDAVAEELAKQPALDAESKAIFADGLANLGLGVTKYVSVGKKVNGMSASLSSASPMMLSKLQPAVYVVTNFPGSMNNVTTALRNAVSYAQSHDIPVPADATQALAAL
ncbi:MAG: hypothetical protein FWF41_00065 [Betaproteobacteria bacterium]|nr:hypothetical protein [Betaproteobacteria bacterium]